MGSKLSYYFLLGFGIILMFFLILGQTFCLINYDWTVSVGLQESVNEVNPLGIAWAKAFALGDTVVYIPLLAAGIIGMYKKRFWGYLSMLGSLAISTYWPVVNLAAIYIGRDELSLIPEKYISYSIILPIITIYGLWGMWFLCKNFDQLVTPAGLR